MPIYDKVLANVQNQPWLGPRPSEHRACAKTFEHLLRIETQNITASGVPSVPSSDFKRPGCHCADEFFFRLKLGFRQVLGMVDQIGRVESSKHILNNVLS